MVVISYRKIREFTLKHSDGSDALNTWYTISEQSDWSNFNEIKEMFNSVDFVGNDRYVFNIRGNKYRLISMIHFNKRTVYILFVGTHK
jgi:mRNA interferase HigB